MNLDDVESFVQENKAKIYIFRDVNPEENLFTQLMEINEKNLDIISKFKGEYFSADEGGRESIEYGIVSLMKCVTDSWSVVPAGRLPANQFFSIG